MSAAILLLIVLALLALRQSIIVILLVATAYIHMVYGDGEILYLIDDLWTSINREVLLAIPMFVLAGSIMTRGSIAERLIDVMRALTQWLPGGLAVATILSCAVFAALSGSSPVTLLAVGAHLVSGTIGSGLRPKVCLRRVDLRRHIGGGDSSLNSDDSVRHRDGKID